MMKEKDLRIRAYLGDEEARGKLPDWEGQGIDDLLVDGILPLEPDFKKEAQKLINRLMRKARRNVELLIGRLEKADYMFVDKEYYIPPTKDAKARMNAFEKKAKVFVPLVYRAWFEIVGIVSLLGSHPSWPMSTYDGLGHTEESVCADPLVVFWTPEWGIDELEELEAYPEYQREEGLIIEFAPDPGHKGNRSSSGSYNLPTRSTPMIDALVTNDDDPKYRRTFLQHLRDSFAKGGFPDWDYYENYPKESLADLAKGLDPL